MPSLSSNASEPGLFANKAFLSLVTVALRAVTLGSKFLLVLALARLLPARELGIYGLMTAGIGFGIVALGVEFHAFAIRQLISSSLLDRAIRLRDQFVFFLLSCVVVLPLALVAFWMKWLPWELVVWFYPILVLEYLSHESARVLIALGRPFAANVVLFFRSGAWVYLCLAWLVFSADRSLAMIWWGWIGGLLVSLFVAARALRHMPWRQAIGAPIQWRWIFRGLRIAPPFLLTAASALSLMYLDRFFISAYQDLTALGVYTFFSGLTIAVHTLVHSGVLSLRIPNIVSAAQDGDEVRFENEMRSLLRTTSVGAFAMAIPAAIAIFPLIWIVGHPEYSDNLNVYFVLLLGAVMRCIAEVPVYRLYAMHRDFQLLAVILASSICIVVSNLILVPRLGIMGAAISSVIAAGLLGVTAWLMPHNGSLADIETVLPGDEV